jgi:hypothetical protein
MVKAPATIDFIAGAVYNKLIGRTLPEVDFDDKNPTVQGRFLGD